MAQFSHLASFGALISDVSEGRVRAGRGTWPLVTYRMQAEDVRKLTRAISLTAQIFFAGGAREVYSALFPRPVLRTPAEAQALLELTLRPQDIEMMAFHPQGTCRMGEDAQSAVTNSFGAYHGVQQLYVADASLFPSSSKVNPQITIMALATRIAEQIASDFRRSN